MFCERCGKEMKEGALFCTNCGWGHSQKKKGNLLLYILPIIAIIIGLFIFINSQKKDNYYANNNDVISNGSSHKNETVTTNGGAYVSADGGNSNNNQTVTRDATSEKIANIKLANSYGLDTSIESMDTVSMGLYYKNDSDENNKKPIEWIVLDRQGNKALLLSKYIIDNKCYHERYENVTWETCTLRNWLNNEFYNKAFSNSEKEKIQITSVANNNNIDTNINGGNSTNDKIFLLSIEEIMQYFGNGEKMKNGYQLGANVSTSGTRYAKDVVNSGQRLWVFDYANNTDADKSERSWADGNSSFWLRSPGNYPKAAALVDYASYLDTKGYGGDNKLTGVRPAMWVTY